MEQVFLGEGSCELNDTGGILREDLVLTEDELKCVFWAVKGKTLQDVACITGIAYRNVRFFIDRARNRNGLSSNIQLYVLVAKKWDIDPV